MSINKDSQKAPNLRFKGFTDDWEQRRLGDILSERSERSEDGDLLSVTINRGVIKASDIDRKDNSSSDKSNYKVVKKNDIAYNSMRMWQGASGLSEYTGIVSPAYTVLIPNQELSPLYMSYLFKNSNLIALFKRFSQGLTSDTWNLKYPLLSSIKINIPYKDEQVKIGTLLKTLDNIITLHQRKLDQLNQLKEALLQQMFPGKGETVPKLRFAGFEGDWEERKLKDVSDMYDNLRVPVTASDRIAGETPYYGANGIQDYVKDYTHIGEFVLIAEDGANDLVKYPVHYVTGEVWVNNHAHVVSAIEGKLDNLFLVSRLKSMNFIPWLVGGGRAKLNGDVLKKLPIIIPHLEEQQKIGSFFKHLDNTISGHQRKLDQLKNMKQVLLQNMFI